MSAYAAARPWRLTPRRQLVLEAVRRALIHPDVQWVYDRVRDKVPNISLATVYRSLAVLAEAGLIRELPDASGPTRYDANVAEHHHARCIVCGRILDVDLGDVTKLRKQVQRLTGFAQVESERLEFYGLCATCAGEGG